MKVDQQSDLQQHAEQPDVLQIIYVANDTLCDRQKFFQNQLHESLA